MNELISFINDRIGRFIKKSDIINATPAIVQSVEDDGWATVQILCNDSIYRLRNLSGANVEVGDACHVYYKKTLTQANSYIGAAIDKQQNNWQYVVGDKQLGALFQDERSISKISLYVSSETSVVLLSYSLTLQGSIDGGISTVAVSIDGERDSYSAICSVDNGKYTTVSHTQPISLNKGVHRIVIYGSGDGVAIDINSFVYGNNIRPYDDYTPTSDGDYIFDSGNGAIIYYIGQANNPKVPLQIENTDVRKIYAIGFDHSDVEAVYIPEGIEEIQ